LGESGLNPEVGNRINLSLSALFCYFSPTSGSRRGSLRSRVLPSFSQRMEEKTRIVVHILNTGREG